MNEQVLVLCPTRSRPKQCKAMVESFLQNSEISTLRLCLDMDDPCLEEYRDTVCKGVSYTIDFPKTTTQIINSNWQYSCECFRWFCVTNDDFVYLTPHWDRKLTSTIKLHGGIGIAYGNDLLQGQRMPTTSVISREIVEALGWLQMPDLTHLFGDTVWQTIGLNAKCLHYRDDVIIEHRHFFGRKALQDEIYLKTNSKAMYDKDTLAYIKWHTAQAKEDIEKVRSLIRFT